MSTPKKQFMYHKDHNVIYAYIEETARQVKAGHVTDLILLDEDHPLVLALLPKVEDQPKRPGGRARPTAVEVPASEARPA